MMAQEVEQIFTEGGNVRPLQSPFPQSPRHPPLQPLLPRPRPPYSPPQRDPPRPPRPQDYRGPPDPQSQCCWRCGQIGHIQYHCPDLNDPMPPAQRQPPGNRLRSGGEEGYSTPGHAPSMHSPARNNCVAEGGPAFPHSGPQVSRVWSWINGKSVCTLVDSGSTVTIIHPDMLPEDRRTSCGAPTYGPSLL